MKKIVQLSALLFFFSSLSFAQINDKEKEYTSMREALINPEKVYRLNLSNQDISLSSEQWSRFVNLEYLNLKNDHLKEIPLEITKIKSLKTIDLSGNDFSKLPDAFSNLVNLEEIYLNDEKNMNLPKTLSILSKLPQN